MLNAKKQPGSLHRCRDGLELPSGSCHRASGNCAPIPALFPQVPWPHAWGAAQLGRTAFIATHARTPLRQGPALSHCHRRLLQAPSRQPFACMHACTQACSASHTRPGPHSHASLLSSDVMQMQNAWYAVSGQAKSMVKRCASTLPNCSTSRSWSSPSLTSWKFFTLACTAAEGIDAL